MGSAIARPPMTAPVGRVGAGGVVMLTPEWAQYLSRLGALQEHGTERGTTAQRPTTDLYDGRKFFDITLGAVVHYKTATSEWVRVIDTDTDTNGLEVVASQSAASATTVDFTTGITSGYEYLLTVTGLVPTTDDAEVWLRVSTDGGASWKAGASDYGWTMAYQQEGGNPTGQTDTADSEIPLTRAATATAGVGNQTGEHLDARIEFGNPASTTLHKKFRIFAGYIAAAGILVGTDVKGRYLATTAIDGVQIGESTGNGFSAGIVTLRRMPRA